MEAIAQCHRVSRSFKQGGYTRKDVLDNLNLAWVVAEKCNVWSENMQVSHTALNVYSTFRCRQVLLTKDLEQGELTALLMTNDRLNDSLRSWEALVSLDITNSGHSDNESQPSTSRPARKMQNVVDSTIERQASSTSEVRNMSGLFARECAAGRPAESRE